MISRSALESIASFLKIEPSDYVLEIGPGLGFLTCVLLKKAKGVIAVEKDRWFVHYLRDLLKDRKNIEIVEEDILQFDFEALRRRPIKCVGNIPYQITSPILEVLMHYKYLWSAVLLTIQKEVAGRLIAEEGSGERSALTCWMGMHAKTQVLKVFTKNCFYPAPQVDSALIQIQFYERPLYAEEDAQITEACIRYAFQKKRKNILNGISQSPLSLSKSVVQDCLEAASINPTTRPQELSLQSWINIAKNINSHLS